MPASGRKIQRKRTGRVVKAPVAKKFIEEDSSQDEESLEEKQGQNDEPQNKKDNEEQNKSDEGDEESFDSNKYEFSSGNESNENDDDDDFSVGKDAAQDDENKSEGDSLESVESEDKPKTRRRTVQRNGRRPGNPSGAAASKKRGHASTRKRAAALSKKEDSSEEEFQSESEGEEQHHSGDEDESSGSGVLKAKKRNTAATRTKRRVASISKGKQPKKTSPTRRTTRARSRNIPNKASSDDESSDGDERDNNQASKRRKPQRKKAATTKRQRKSVSKSSESGSVKSSSEEDLDEITTPKRNPRQPTPASIGSRSRRRSAQKAMASLAKLDEDDEDEDLIPKSFRRKNQDDEEFNADENDGNDDENESAEDFDPDDDSIVDKNELEDKKMVGLVDDNDIGSAEESGEENTTTRPYQSPNVKLVYQSPVRVSKNSALQESSEDEPDETENKKSRKSFSPAMPCCPSERDAITDEPLPAKHICFFPPDGESRQCFALETLHKIATSAAFQQIRQDLTGRVVQTFLQPPHFRSAMSDDLLDQIASRFGRDALDLHGEYYKRPTVQADHPAVEDVEEEFPDVSDDFVQQVKDYVRSQMGSCDLYVCPVCYSVARRKYNAKGVDGEEVSFESDSKESDETLFAKYIEVKPQDPLKVLSSLDGEVPDFITASSFCFPKVATLKQHLRSDHGLATKNVVGNDLYNMFKIRTTDGLLQRFLKSIFRGRVGQGDMQRYWFAGNNFDFLYLHSLVEEAAIHRDVLAQADDDKNDDAEFREARNFGKQTEAFFGSFECLAERLWHLLSDPYLKETGKELKDFLAADDKEVEDDVNAHRRFDREREKDDNGLLTQEDEEDIARYERHYQEEASDNLEDDIGDDLEDSEPDENDAGEEAGEQLLSSSDEEDEWEQNIKKRRKVKRPTKGTPRQRRSRTSTFAGSSRGLSDSEDRTSNPVKTRKRLTIQESDED